MRLARLLLTALPACCLPAVPEAQPRTEVQSQPAGLVEFAVEGDGVPLPLGGLQGDPARGKAIVLDREKGNCLICHSLPAEGEPFQGDIGPSLTGVGSRLTAAQIRLRLIDQGRINPDTLMPPYYRIEGLNEVAAEYRGRPALEAQEIEDVVRYLESLEG